MGASPPHPNVRSALMLSREPPLPPGSLTPTPPHHPTVINTMILSREPADRLFDPRSSSHRPESSGRSNT